MKRTGYILLFLIFTGGMTLRAQPLIGRHATEVEQYIRFHQKDLALDNTTRNTAYKYLKFVDQLGYQTLLVFLSEQDTCTWYKKIYDLDFLDKVIEELDQCCQRETDTSWIEVFGEQRYRKTLKKQDWFFSVSTHPLTGK